MTRLMTALVLAGTFFTFRQAIAAARPAITIALAPSTKIDRQEVAYHCRTDQQTADARTAETTMFPKNPLVVQYINADAISIAVLSLAGQVQVFSNVISADGAKYAAGQYEWWSKGDSATLRDAMNPKVTFTCLHFSARKR